jgi:hypothetical protein
MDVLKKQIEEKKRKLAEQKAASAAVSQGSAKYVRRGDLEREREAQVQEQRRREEEERVRFSLWLPLSR